MRVREEDLPVCVRQLLEAARTMRPAHEVVCIEFHTRESGRVIAQMGPDTGVVLDSDGRTTFRLWPKDILVLSVAVTETTFTAAHTVTHVLIALIRPRRPVARGHRVDTAKAVIYDRDR